MKTSDTVGSASTVFHPVQNPHFTANINADNVSLRKIVVSNKILCGLITEKIELDIDDIKNLAQARDLQEVKSQKDKNSILYKAWQLLEYIGSFFYEKSAEEAKELIIKYYSGTPDMDDKYDCAMRLKELAKDESALNYQEHIKNNSLHFSLFGDANFIDLKTIPPSKEQVDQYIKGCSNFLTPRMVNFIKNNPGELRKIMRSVVVRSTLDQATASKVALTRQLFNVGYHKDYTVKKDVNRQILGNENSFFNLMNKTDACMKPGNGISIDMVVPILDSSGNPIIENGKIKRVLITSVPGAALDNPNQPEFRHQIYTLRSGRLIGVNLDNNGDLTLSKNAPFSIKMRSITDHIASCARNNPDRPGVVLSAVGMDSFLHFLCDADQTLAKKAGTEAFAKLIVDLRKEHKDNKDFVVSISDLKKHSNLTTGFWEDINAAVANLAPAGMDKNSDEAKFYQPIKWIGEIPGNWVTDKHIIVNAWDPHSLVGNRCKWDKSFDGAIGTEFAVHFGHAALCMLFSAGHRLNNYQALDYSPDKIAEVKKQAALDMLASLRKDRRAQMLALLRAEVKFSNNNMLDEQTIKNTLDELVDEFIHNAPNKANSTDGNDLDEQAIKEVFANLVVEFADNLFAGSGVHGSQIPDGDITEETVTDVTPEDNLRQNGKLTSDDEVVLDAAFIKNVIADVAIKQARTEPDNSSKAVLDAAFIKNAIAEVAAKQKKAKPDESAEDQQNEALIKKTLAALSPQGSFSDKNRLDENKIKQIIATVAAENGFVSTAEPHKVIDFGQLRAPNYA